MKARAGVSWAPRALRVSGASGALRALMVPGISRALAVAIAVSFFSVSCMSGVESMVADVSPGGWNEPAELRYSNTDTLSTRKLTLALRYSQSAGPAHGRYVVETTAPSGATERDTLSIATSPDAQRNRMQEAEVAISTRRLTETGDYRFTILPPRGTVGVWSVGMELR